MGSRKKMCAKHLRMLGIVALKLWKPLNLVGDRVKLIFSKNIVTDLGVSHLSLRVHHLLFFFL